jgi:hypothetical protein
MAFVNLTGEKMLFGENKVIELTIRIFHRAIARPHLDYLSFRARYNCADMKGMFRVLCCVLIPAGFFSAAQPQSSKETASTQVSPVQQTREKVPVVDGGAGPCYLELTVTGADGKPVYAATVKIHIGYGFGGMRKLDLENFGHRKMGSWVSRCTIRQLNAKPNTTSGWKRRRRKRPSKSNLDARIAADYACRQVLVLKNPVVSAVSMSRQVDWRWIVKESLFAFHADNLCQG